MNLIIAATTTERDAAFLHREQEGNHYSGRSQYIWLWFAHRPSLRLKLPMRPASHRPTTNLFIICGHRRGPQRRQAAHVLSYKRPQPREATFGSRSSLFYLYPAQKEFGCMLQRTIPTAAFRDRKQANHFSERSQCIWLWPAHRPSLRSKLPMRLRTHPRWCVDEMVISGHRRGPQRRRAAHVCAEGIILTPPAAGGARWRPR